MKRLAVLLFVGFACVIGTPAPAHASIWRYIDELSGPGPFKGYQYEWRVACFGELPENPENNVTQLSADAQRKREARKVKAAALIIAGIGPCLVNQVPAGKHRRWSVNTAVAWLGTSNNRFAPAGSSEDERRVRLKTFDATLMWQAYRGFDVGTGAGVYWFGGKSFDSFSRTALIPVRSDVRGAELGWAIAGKDIDAGPWWWLAIPAYRFDVVVIPRGFDGADFGGAPERFAPSDTLFNHAIVFDLDPVVRRIINH